MQMFERPQIDGLKTSHQGFCGRHERCCAQQWLGSASIFEALF